MRRILSRTSLFAGPIALATLAGVATAQNLKSTLVQSGLLRPIYVTAPPGDTHRLFVVLQAGQVKIIKDGTLLATNFLDIDPLVGGGNSNGDEHGLLGFAFHPNFATNRKFYVCYSDASFNDVIKEYTASVGNPDVADTSAPITIFGPQADLESNHNGGNIQFGPDGKLYYGLGDGGGSCDVHGTNGNGQNLSSYNGKLLRIDVDNPPTYVPAGNPFGASSFPLIWAWGLRNPWRWSFDSLTGDLYIGDVGQNAVEEVDFQPASSAGGENYGWRYYEGNTLGGSGCNTSGNTGPAGKVFPIQTYSHGSGCTIVGGYVYRGSAISGLQGTYFYADYCVAKIWSFTFNGTTVSNFTDRTSQLNTGSTPMSSITSFGQDASGELYICDYAGGRLYRIDRVCPAPTTFCVTSPNSVGPGAIIGSTGTGIIPQNNLNLAATGCPSTINGIFFYGDGQTQVPLGNGFRCIGSSFIRLPVVQTNLFGDANYVFDNTTAPAGVIVPGATKSFQFWYRDTAAGGSNFNLTNGLSVTFCGS